MIGASLGVLSLCSICYALAWYYIKMKKYKQSGIPAPNGFIRFLILIFTNHDAIKAYQLLNQKYGDIFRNLTFVFLRSPEYLEILYTNPALQQRPKVKTVENLIGATNLVTSGPHRAKILKKYYFRYFVNVPHMDSLKISAHGLVTKFRENVGPNGICSLEHIKNSLTTAALRTTFGEDTSKYTGLLELILNVDNNNLMSVLRQSSPIYRNNFLFYNFLGGRKMERELEQTKKLSAEIIQQKKVEKDEYEKRGENVPENFIFGLLQEKEEDDEIDIVSEFITQQSTALGTTSTLISFALLMIAMHPEIQEQVVEEDNLIQEELRIAGREMEDKDLPKYENLQRVIKETLRLYPPFPFVIRYANDDVRIGKYTIPKGAKVLGSVLSVQRDPRLFKDPLKFDPDRFKHENTKNIQKNSYVPFSSGMRSCPGGRYGILSATYFIAIIIRNFKISTAYRKVEELDDNLGAALTLYDKKHFRIFLEHRLK